MEKREVAYNFIKAAEKKNAENLLILKSKELAGKCSMNWEEYLEKY